MKPVPDGAVVPWGEELAGVREVLRQLGGPVTGLAALLSAEDALLGLLASSPEDLPLISFSPFAGIPEPARGDAGAATGGGHLRGGRSPATPAPRESAPRGSAPKESAPKESVLRERRSQRDQRSAAAGGAPPRTGREAAAAHRDFLVAPGAAPGAHPERPERAERTEQTERRPTMAPSPDSKRPEAGAGWAPLLPAPRTPGAGAAANGERDGRVAERVPVFPLRAAGRASLEPTAVGQGLGGSRPSPPTDRPAHASRVPTASASRIPAASASGAITALEARNPPAIARDLAGRPRASATEEAPAQAQTPVESGMALLSRLARVEPATAGGERESRPGVSSPHEGADESLPRPPSLAQWTSSGTASSGGAATADAWDLPRLPSPPPSAPPPPLERPAAGTELLGWLADGALHRLDGAAAGHRDLPAEAAPPSTVAARLAAEPLASLRDPAPPGAPASAIPVPSGPFAGEALADLVNEALVEQARRHGVDLS